MPELAYPVRVRVSRSPTARRMREPWRESRPARWVRPTEGWTGSLQAYPAGHSQGRSWCLHAGSAFERSHTVHTLVLTVDLSRCSHVLTPTLVRCSYRRVLTPQMVYEHPLQIASTPLKLLTNAQNSLKIAPILKMAKQSLLKTA